MGSLFKFKRAASKEAASEKEESKFFGSRKNFFEKNKIFRKKSIDNRKRNRLNGQPFQIQTSGFGRSGEWGWGKVKKRSSLKFTKYDCANLPKIFLAKNFE